MQNCKTGLNKNDIGLYLKLPFQLSIHCWVRIEAKAESMVSIVRSILDGRPVMNAEWFDISCDFKWNVIY